MYVYGNALTLSFSSVWPVLSQSTPNLYMNAALHTRELPSFPLLNGDL